MSKQSYNKLFASLTIYMVIFSIVPMLLILFIKDTNLILSLTVLAAFLAVFLMMDRKRFFQALKETRQAPGWLLIFLIFAPMATNILGGLFSEGLNKLLMLVGLEFEKTSSEMAREVATSLSLMLALYTCLLAPLFEEFVFRGYLLRSIERPKPWLAVVLSGVMFAIMHTNLGQTTSLIVTAIYFSYLGLRYSMWVPIVVHVANNSLFYLLSLFPGKPGSVMENASIGLMMFGIVSFVIVLVSAVKYYRQTRHVGWGEEVPYRNNVFLWLYFAVCIALIILNDYVL